MVHGHICPEKILVNAMSADIKLSDLGRCVVEGCSVAGSYNMSYMCPEELVVKQQPSAKGDVWAAGCVYAELLEKKGPLFEGSTHKEVLAKICARYGVKALRHTTDKLCGVLQHQNEENYEIELTQKDYALAVKPIAKKEGLLASLPTARPVLSLDRYSYTVAG